MYVGLSKTHCHVLQKYYRLVYTVCNTLLCTSAMFAVVPPTTLAVTHTTAVPFTDVPFTALPFTDVPLLDLCHIAESSAAVLPTADASCL